MTVSTQRLALSCSMSSSGAPPIETPPATSPITRQARAARGDRITVVVTVCGTRRRPAGPARRQRRELERCGCHPGHGCGPRRADRSRPPASRARRAQPDVTPRRPVRRRHRRDRSAPHRARAAGRRRSRPGVGAAVGAGETSAGSIGDRSPPASPPPNDEAIRRIGAARARCSSTSRPPSMSSRGWTTGPSCTLGRPSIGPTCRGRCGVQSSVPRCSRGWRTRPRTQCAPSSRRGPPCAEPQAPIRRADGRHRQSVDAGLGGRERLGWGPSARAGERGDGPRAAVRRVPAGDISSTWPGCGTGCCPCSGRRCAAPDADRPAIAHRAGAADGR